MNMLAETDGTKWLLCIEYKCSCYVMLCLKSVTTYVWLYNLICGWHRTSAYIGAAGSRYPSICDLTQHINEWNKAQPQHRELHALVFATSVWVLLRPTGLCEQWRVVRRGLRFIVLIREGLDYHQRHLPTKQALTFPFYFKTLCLLSPMYVGFWTDGK